MPAGQSSRNQDYLRGRGCNDLSDAEMQLISALRTTGDFLISIQHRDGRFSISQNFNRPATGGPTFGSGDTFEEAWDAARAD